MGVSLTDLRRTYLLGALELDDTATLSMADLELALATAGWAEGGSVFLDTDIPAVIGGSHQVVNSAAETTISTMTIPAADIEINQSLEVLYVIDWINNSGTSPVTLTLKQKLGATTIYWYANLSLNTGANRSKVFLRTLYFLPSLNVQRHMTFMGGGSAAASNVTTMSTAFSQVGAGTSAEDLSANKDLTLTAQLSLANALADCRLLWASINPIKAA